MNKHRTLMPGNYGRPRAPASERLTWKAHRGQRPDRLDARTGSAQVLDRDSRAVHRADPAERPGASVATFRSVLCADDKSINSRAAHDQAVLLASPGGTVERVPTPQLTYRGRRALHDACSGHDLVALGAGPAAFAAVGRAPIPVLVARWCPLGTEVADTILVPVDDSPESARAVALAGRLAATHGGTVTILGAPPRDPAFQRAIAASGRVLLQATGAAPRLFGQQLPREHAIPDAAVAVGASLIALGAGSGEAARRMTAQIAGRVGCSVLTVPALAPDRRFARDQEGGHAAR